MSDVSQCKKHPGADYDPDTNFCCKMGHMRRHGAFGVTWQGGRDTFHNEDSWRARDKAHRDEMTAAGIKFDRAPS